MKITRAAGASLLAAGVVAAAVGFGGGAASADPATLTVGNQATCPSAMYRTIQAAVDAASPGDTITVCAGAYGEQVDIATPDLTLEGAKSGMDARVKSRTPASVVTNTNGVFTIESGADGTTIDGFTITGASSNNSDGIADFQGASGLTLENNVIQLNGNGLNMQNPDGSQPALITQNNFINNNAGTSGQSGTGIFISNGPADNTTISDNSFSKHSQTAINFAGDSSNPSAGLQVYDNRSTDDSSFVVATNSNGAVIDGNTVTTHDANVPGGHGTGILDFGANANLRISNNVLKATTTTSMSSGISVSNAAGSSAYTNVVDNTVSGYYNDLKVVTGNTSAFLSGNHLSGALNDGIIVQSGVSGVVLTHNVAVSAQLHGCEDDTTGSGTAGTANIWLKDRGLNSTPAGICS